MPKKIDINFSKEELISELKEKGQELLACELSISSNTLRKKIKELGIERKDYSKKNKFTIEEKLNAQFSRDELIELLNIHKGKRQTSKALNVSDSTLDRVLRLKKINRKDYKNPLIGRKAWNSGTASRFLCEMCNKEFTAEPSKKRRFCSRICSGKWFKIEYAGDKFSGNKNPNFKNGDALRKAWKEGKFDNLIRSIDQFTKGKWTWYKGIHFRSTWEAEFAKELDNKNLDWEYEPKRFILSNGQRYMPDFYVKSEDKYYEVKGYWWPKSKKKFNLFLSEYPEINIEVKGIDWWNSRNA